jgi:hypothetical protein
MPAARLSDSQKAEVVERFRAGEGMQPLADAYGCSPNTVSRVVKAALDPGEYDRLKEQRSRRTTSSRRGSTEPDPVEENEHSASHPAGPTGDDEASGVAVSPEVDPPTAEMEADAPSEELGLPAPSVAPDRPQRLVRRLGTRSRPDAAAAAQEDGPAVLAIDDADDFGDDEGDDDLSLDADGDDSEGQTFVPVPLLEVVDDHTEIRPLPLTAADLRGSAWMLVDKTVELQARPLSEFTELGRLPAEEQDRQALMVFVNPRQAKRHCGRTQRVIKIPDPEVFTRTAPYLLAQGISRVVIEGALFALPGS